LDRAGQLEVLKKLLGDDPLDDFMRASPVAPQIAKVREIDAGDANGRGRGVDVWFVAHGKFDKLASKTLQGQFGGAGSRVTPLKDGDLEKRKIALGKDADIEETYFHAVAS